MTKWHTYGTFTAKVNKKKLNNVAMTTRKIEGRLKGHITDIKYSKSTTAL